MPTEAAPRPSAARVTIAGICALVLTMGIARFAYTPLLPVMRQQAGLGAIDAGWLAAIGYVGYLAGALIASAIHSLRHKWILYRIGLALAVVTTLAMSGTQNVWVWLALRLVAGWTGTAGVLIGTGLVLNWLIRNHHRPALGLHFSGAGAGITLSGLAAVAMAGHVDWRGQWVILGIVGFGLLVPAWRWLPAPTVASHTADMSAAALPSRRWMALFAFAYFCAGIGYVVTATYIVAIIGDMHTAITGNWVWVVMGLSATPACPVWDRLALLVGPARALTLAYALQTGAIALLAFGGGPIPILLGAVLFGAAMIGTVSLTLTIVGVMAPANPARAMARLTVSYGLAQILGPVAAAYMAGPTGGYHASLALAVAVGVPGTLVSLACWPSRQMPAPADARARPSAAASREI